MGLLDDLKKQADMVKSQQLSQQSMLEDSTALVETKMNQTFLYLNDLLKQLAVLRPTNPTAYSIPGVGDFQNLGFTESFINYRKKKIGDKDHFDFITMFIKWSSPANLTVERDMPAAIQKVNEVLWGFGLKFTEEKIMKPGGGFEKMKFTVPSSVTCDLTISADHANGRLVVKGKHFFRLGPDELRIPAGDVNEALLEEFAKMLIGQASVLRKYRVATL
ncbi:MAG: hypothetical protein D4R74_14100 [Betaproteobacteria bacterium]|nr:MAG: hypothetical protein D4R74_14100 [Betaproteobacteria bacterium]